jgi:hypothetical protein
MIWFVNSEEEKYNNEHESQKIEWNKVLNIE